MKSSKIAFYDQYHQKNDRYTKVIERNNFTYYLTLKLLDQFFPQFKDIRALDVGCGVGTISLYLAKQGVTEVTGIDVSQRAIEISAAAQKSLGYKNVQFKHQELSKGKNECDLVTCFEVIEHIEDDRKFLQLIKTHLKKGGLLVLSTPLSENILYGLGFYKKFDQEVGHLRRYTVSGLQELLRSEGFEVKEVLRAEGVFRNILFTTKLGFVIRFIKGPLVPLVHFIDATLMPLFGATDVLVVAKRL